MLGFSVKEPLLRGRAGGQKPGTTYGCTMNIRVVYLLSSTLKVMKVWLKEPHHPLLLFCFLLLIFSSLNLLTWLYSQWKTFSASPKQKGSFKVITCTLESSFAADLGADDSLWAVLNWNLKMACHCKEWWYHPWTVWNIRSPIFFQQIVPLSLSGVV